MISQIGETKKNSAFSLVEILLVIIIFGIVTALAAPNFAKVYSRAKFNNTTDDLLTVSRWAQAMAIGQQRIYVLSFSEDRRSFSLVRVKDPLQNEASGNIDESPDKVEFEPVKGAVGRKHKLPDAIFLEADTDRIEFYPDGTIDPATIKLKSSDQKSVISSLDVRGMMTKVDRE